MLLSAMLGPWAGFLSMIVILAIQALFFADGGLLALGANVWNMAFYGCFVGYFLIYRPLMRGNLSAGKARLRLTLASVLGCVATLQLGAFSVVLETTHHGAAARRVRGAHAADPSGDRSGRGADHGGGAAAVPRGCAGIVNLALPGCIQYNGSVREKERNKRIQKGLCNLWIVQN